jgi:hypothetical protein
MLRRFQVLISSSIYKNRCYVNALNNSKLFKYLHAKRFNENTHYCISCDQQNMNNNANDNNEIYS